MNSSTKGVPMTKDETMLLVQLVAAKPILNNKSTNATNNKMKEDAWQSLSVEFNSSVSSFPRTPAQLRLKWENLKKSSRKRSASIRSSQNKIGGGKDYYPPDKVLDKVASLLEKTLDKEESIKDNLIPKKRLMQEASVSKQKALQSCSNAKETFSPETSRQSIPQSEYPLQENYTVEPQAVNYKNQEEHEINQTFSYLKDIKDLLEKTLDKKESLRDNLIPKIRLIQEASVSKQKAPQSSTASHEEIDGDKYFVLSLLPTLKQMNDDQKLAAKMRIWQALQEVRKINFNQNIMYVEDSAEDALKVELLDEDNSDSSSHA